MQEKEYTLEIAGKKITAIFSNLADQANGSVILKCEDTIVMATAVISKSAEKSLGFFNLTVEYLEKYYAAGLILGGQYNKREGKPSDEAILSSRIIDRTIRPLFDHHIKNAVQVIITVLSVGQADPGVLGINAASLALGVSDIPWSGPMGAVHIGKVKGENEIKYDEYIVNKGEPVYDIDLTVCGRDGHICMIEAMTFEIDEATVGVAFDKAMTYITEIEDWQKKIISEIGKTKMEFPKPVVPETVKEKFAQTIGTKLMDGVFSKESKSKIEEYKQEWKEIVEEMYPPSTDYNTNKNNEASRAIAEDYYHHEVDIMVHIGATEKNLRVDGRGFDDVRGLYAKAGGFSSMLHGSGIFYRGETHVFSALTLGGPADLYVLDGMEVRGEKRFMHHYNFPPYSAGETGRVGGLNRREMGHGMLAEKALVPVLPNKMDFPYTIRLVSESMASNGSTSQASICASTLALMDGGVPIKAPVAGIAIGLMIDENNPKNYKILTDIQGLEDHHGDMDFKVAGTRNGITALQLDIKVGGILPSILKEALVKAKTARLTILDTIEKELAKPRTDISPKAPKILIMKVKVEQIGLVIGGGGKTINGIKDKTGAEINIEDDGTVFITGKGNSAEEAKKIIESLTHEWRVGDRTEGLVMKILDIGAVVALSEYADGLVHISEIAPFRVNKVTDVLKEGQRVPVKVVAVDAERGRISLSIKEADKDFIKNPYPPAQPRSTPPPVK
jgi:polyribonucleotide nucleotidyltransferase